MIHNAWQRLLSLLASKYIQPKMVYNYRCHDGTRLPRTRVSNMTHIDTPERLKIGDNVWIGHFNLIDASGGLIIGEGCQITNHVSLLTHSSHVALRLYGEAYLYHSEHAGYLKASSKIGPYTFIGPHSVLMPAVIIGKGCIVSAYSYVVAGQYPDFAVLAGNPAKVVGDTREIDRHWLEEHPQLRPYYEDWANEQP